MGGAGWSHNLHRRSLHRALQVAAAVLVLSHGWDVQQQKSDKKIVFPGVIFFF